MVKIYNAKNVVEAEEIAELLRKTEYRLIIKTPLAELQCIRCPALAFTVSIFL